MSTLRLTKEFLDEVASHEGSRILIAVPSFALWLKLSGNCIPELLGRAYTTREIVRENGATIRLVVLNSNEAAYDLSGTQFTNILIHENCPQEPHPYLRSRLRAVNFLPPMWLKEFTL